MYLLSRLLIVLSLRKRVRNLFTERHLKNASDNKKAENLSVPNLGEHK